MDYSKERSRLSHLSLGLAYRTRLTLDFIPDGASVLDIGAADGKMMETIRHERTLSGFASVEASIPLAAKIPANGICARADSLPFQAGCFDRVTCCATRKHIKESARMMEEIARVLKPGGLVIVLDPHPWFIRLGVKLGKFDPKYLHHLSYARDVAAEMRQAGLVPERQSDGLFVVTTGRKP